MTACDHRADPPRVNLVHLTRVASTMDLLDELAAAGAPEWTVVLADEQTAGLGRAGRRWEAEPATALLCSVLVRPRAGSAAGGMLAIGAGVAVAELLADIGVDVRLKWPNDVLLDDGKIAGILVRTRHDLLGLAVNVGVGLNLTRGSSGGDGRAALADVLRAVPPPAELVSPLVVCLDRALHGREISSIREAWSVRAAFLGEPVGVAVEGTMLRGRMIGIDDAGALLIELPDGAVRRVVAGDLVRGPRPETTPRPSILGP